MRGISESLNSVSLSKLFGYDVESTPQHDHGGRHDRSQPPVPPCMISLSIEINQRPARSPLGKGSHHGFLQLLGRNKRHDDLRLLSNDSGSRDKRD